MSFVLADQRGWLGEKEEEAFAEHVAVGKLEALRRAVQDKSADFFMWEHFTTKHYWDNGELKRVGEIYTPWPSWMIAAREPGDERVKMMLGKIDEGVRYYREHREEAIGHITGTMEYSRSDAEEWMGTVEFAKDVKGVETGVVDRTIEVLRKGGVLDEMAGRGEEMVGIQRGQAS